MTYVTWKLERRAYDNTLTPPWSTTPEVITDFSSPIVEVNSGDAKDSFSVTLDNFNGEYNDYFQPQDKITISRASNTTTLTDDHILMVGAIKSPPYNVTGNRNQIKLEGYNFSEMVFTAIIPKLDANGLTPPQVIQQALNQVAAYNPQFRITWNASNPSTKSDGSSFSPVYDIFANTTLQSIVEKMTSDQYTRDGTYIYYVNNANEFVLRANTTGTTRGFNSAVDEFESLKIGKDVKGIINFVVVKGGRDPQRNPIQNRYVDMVSVSKHGMKYFVYTDPGIKAETLNMLDLDKSDPTKKGKHTQSYPYSYPFTCAWVSQATAGSQLTINSNANYVQVMREEILYRMEVAANEILYLYKNGKLSIDIGFAAGSKDWQLLDRVTCTIPEAFAAPKVLRVREISYTSGTDIYSLVEDKGTL